MKTYKPHPAANLKPVQIDARIDALESLSDFRVGGQLWRAARDAKPFDDLQTKVGLAPLSKQLQRADAAMATFRDALASSVYGPKLRALVREFLEKECT